MEIGIYLTAAAIGYLLGSIPTGYLVAKARGVDIRTVGSGSTGATNVTRGLGKAAGIFVLVFDIAKGIIAVLACHTLLGHPYQEGTPEYKWLAQQFEFFDAPIGPPFLELSAGIAVVFGHNFPIWLKFDGGKGVATSLGVIYLLWPTVGIIALWVWAVVFIVWRWVSLASIIAALSTPIIFIGVNNIDKLTGKWAAFHDKLPSLLAIAFLTVLLVARHHENIARLRAGTEPKFSFKKTEPPSQPPTESQS